MALQGVGKERIMEFMGVERDLILALVDELHKNIKRWIDTIIEESPRQRLATQSHRLS